MSFENLDELFAYIESFTNLERSGSLFSARTYRLDRMRLLLEHFGDPQLSYRTIHLAGTKGKGSTAVLLAEGLAQAGLRTGLYTSPHVQHYRERIRRLPEPLGDDRLLALGRELPPAVQLLAGREELGPPNTFELLTLLAFLAFREGGCEIVVVETGIGGRLDATNLVLPELSLLTPMELEHTEVLGDTLEAIAREKGGIVKPGVPVLSAAQSAEAAAVLREIAAERGCPLAFVPEEVEITEVRCDPAGTTLRLRLRGEQERPLRLALLGRHQAENAALAALALRRLGLPWRGIAAGFRRATLPARMELLRRRPPVVVDGAHTPLSVERLLASFRELFPGGPVLLFAAAAGKRIREMAAVLAPACPRVVVTTPGSFRESRPEEVYRAFLSLNPATELVPEPRRALARALELAGAAPLLVTGSFYLAGEIRRAWFERRRIGAPGGRG